MKKKLILSIIPLAVLAGCVSQQDASDHRLLVIKKIREPEPPIDPPLYCNIDKMEMMRENKTGFGASTANGGWAAHLSYSTTFTFNQAPGIYQFEYAMPYTNLPWGAYQLEPGIPATLIDWPITNYENAPKTVTLPTPPTDVSFFRLRKMYELPKN